MLIFLLLLAALAVLWVVVRCLLPEDTSLLCFLVMRIGDLFCG